MTDHKAYIVPMEIPKHCNECPFSYLNYSFPIGGSSISNIDGKENKKGTYGYVCNVDFGKNGKYTKILRAECEEKIKRPKWCGLKELKNEC